MSNLVGAYVNFVATREKERVGLREIHNDEFVISIPYQFYLSNKIRGGTQVGQVALMKGMRKL